MEQVKFQSILYYPRSNHDTHELGKHG